eukprot:SAG11_NODE_11967_length_728_cov_1.648649_1_plen_72_part_00
MPWQPIPSPYSHNIIPRESYFPIPLTCGVGITAVRQAPVVLAVRPRPAGQAGADSAHTRALLAADHAVARV